MSNHDGDRDRQQELLAVALGCDGLEPFAVGGESRTFRLTGTDLLASVPSDWPERRPAGDELTAHAELLARIGERVGVPVPDVVRVLPDVGCIVVRRLPGVPLIRYRSGELHAGGVGVASVLGTLLGELHTWNPSAYADLAPVDRHLPTDWRDETAELVAELEPALTREQLVEVRRFLAAPAPAPSDRWAFSHNDLGIEHVLVEPGATGPRVTGVIDWGDAAVIDPAYDFALVLRDLGPVALDGALASYERTGADPRGIADRAAFYAACTLVEDLAFGLANDRAEYVDKSLAGWERTFSP